MACAETGFALADSAPPPDVIVPGLGSPTGWTGAGFAALVFADLLAGVVAGCGSAAGGAGAGFVAPALAFPAFPAAAGAGSDALGADAPCAAGEDAPGGGGADTVSAFSGGAPPEVPGLVGFNPGCSVFRQRASSGLLWWTCKVRRKCTKSQASSVLRLSAKEGMGVPSKPVIKILYKSWLVSPHLKREPSEKL